MQVSTGDTYGLRCSVEQLINCTFYCLAAACSSVLFKRQLHLKSIKINTNEAVCKGIEL